MPLIELKNVTKRFGKNVVLDRLNLSIDRGQSLVVIGPSGTGKSVMLKHIVGLLRPDQGQIFFDGKDVAGMTDTELMAIRVRFGFLFQLGALFDSLTVAENVAFPLVEHSNKSPDEIRDAVAQKLKMVGLPDAGKKMPGELSGGQKKRIALARAIALDPEVILYDEPTTGLDPIRADVINELILKMHDRLHVTSITVTHDMASAMKIATRIVMLTAGKIIFDGTPDDLRTSNVPDVQRFVKGEASEEELAELK